MNEKKKGKKSGGMHIRMHTSMYTPTNRYFASGLGLGAWCATNHLRAATTCFIVMGRPRVTRAIARSTPSVAPLRR